MTHDDRSFIGIGFILIICSLGGGAAHPVIGVGVFVVGLVLILIFAAIGAGVEKVRKLIKPEPKFDPDWIKKLVEEDNKRIGWPPPGLKK